jgi:hypothetical protein
VQNWNLPEMLGTITDSLISLDDRFLYFERRSSNHFNLHKNEFMNRKVLDYFQSSKSCIHIVTSVTTKPGLDFVDYKIRILVSQKMKNMLI